MREIKEKSSELELIRDNCIKNKKEETEKLASINIELKDINTKYSKTFCDDAAISIVICVILFLESCSCKLKREYICSEKSLF